MYIFNIAVEGWLFKCKEVVSAENACRDLHVLAAMFCLAVLADSDSCAYPQEASLRMASS